MKFPTLFTFSKEISRNDTSGHDFGHVQRVYRTAVKLLAQIPGADADIVLAAALLHDSYDDKLVADVAVAKKRAEKALAETGLSAGQRHEVFAIIDQMGFKANLEYPQALTLEGQIVQDADRLDALGAVGIARAMMYGATHGATLFDPNQPPREQFSAADYRGEQGTIVNHFYEKLFKLAGTMNTPAARELALQRTQIMRDYLDELMAEWNGTR